jgi:hypothetical protein
MEDKESPLGIMSKYIWIELRIKDLCKAINNFIDANKIDDNVQEWIKEVVDHCIKQIPEFVKLSLQQKIELVTQKVFVYTITNKLQFANLIKNIVITNDIDKIKHCEKICGILDNLTIVKNSIWLNESKGVVDALDCAITSIEEINFK